MYYLTTIVTYNTAHSSQNKIKIKIQTFGACLLVVYGHRVLVIDAWSVLSTISAYNKELTKEILDPCPWPARWRLFAMFGGQKRGLPDAYDEHLAALVFFFLTVASEPSPS